MISILCSLNNLFLLKIFITVYYFYSNYYIHKCLFHIFSVKFPQILKILNAKSAEGISFLSVLLELIAVTSAASYNFAKGYPFR